MSGRATPGQQALAAEQAAQRRKERRVLLTVLAGLLVVIVGAALGYQAWRDNRSPDATAVTPLRRRHRRRSATGSRSPGARPTRR